MSSFELKLLKHQRELYDCKDSIAGLVCGRGAGKTVIMAWIIAIALIEGKRIMAFSQTYKSLSQNLFNEIINCFTKLGLKPEYNKTAMTMTFNKGQLFGFSYDSYESCRGLTEIQLLVLDELAMAPSDLLAVCTPCCRGNFTPVIRFCTSPRAGSYWNRWFKEGMASGAITVFTAKMSDNTFLSRESLRLSEQSINDPILKRQELFGEIIDSVVENCIINFDLAKKPMTDDKKYVMGVDVARFGNDSTVIIIRNGTRIIHREEIFHGDTFTIVSKIDALEREYGTLKHIYIDSTGGYGSGIEDMLKLSHDNVTAVNFGGKATDEYSFNCRSEMYFNLTKALEDGFYIDSSTYNMIIDELYATSYFITQNGKRAIVPKDKIKEIIGRSPDSADALALTFYKPMQTNQIKISPQRQNELISCMFR